MKFAIKNISRITGCRQLRDSLHCNCKGMPSILHPHISRIVGEHLRATSRKLSLKKKEITVSLETVLANEWSLKYKLREQLTQPAAEIFIIPDQRISLNGESLIATSSLDSDGLPILKS
jgi:riboflavin biosynthesis pyrimidine reductase